MVAYMSFLWLKPWFITLAYLTMRGGLNVFYLVEKNTVIFFLGSMALVLWFVLLELLF